VAERGRFIVFEGIDGSGKSTAIRTVADALDRDDVVVTREETESWRGDAVRRHIDERGDPWATLHLFLADRAAHVPEIMAHLAAGKHVLCDRFLHSTLAYQSVTLAGQMDDPVDHLRSLHEPWCIAPDHVILFDLSPEIALERIHGRGDTTPYEKVDFLTKVRSSYHKLATTDGFTILDASRAAAEVSAEALDTVRHILDAE
jgi:dTMP kinase